MSKALMMSVMVASAMAQSVTLKVWDAEKPEELFQLRNGGTINGYRAQQLSVEADVSGGNYGQVIFFLDDKNVRAEAAAPYFLFGDIGVNPIPGQIAPGSHTLEAKVYQGNKVVATTKVSFTIPSIGGISPDPVPVSQPVAQPVASPVGAPSALPAITFEVWDPEDNKELFTLRNNGRINEFRAKKFSIEAVAPGSFSFVRFSLDGKISDEQNSPFFLFGDRNGKPITGAISGGNHVLWAQRFNNQGPLGPRTTVSFTVPGGNSIPVPAPVPAPVSAPVSKPVQAPVMPAGPPTGSGNPECDVQESACAITAEFESFANRNGWNQITDNSASGNRAMVWRSGNWFNGPYNKGQSTLRFENKTPGIWLVQWQNGFTGSNPTEENDSYIRINVGGDSFASRNPKGSTKYYARGTRSNVPRPVGSSGSGFFKAYRSNRDKWNWNTYAGDFQNLNIYANFRNPGVYTLDISGRSVGHKIDKIMLVRVADNNGNANGLRPPISASRTKNPVNC